MAVAPVLPPIAKPKPVPAPPPPDALLANPDAAMKPRWVARVGVDAALATVGYDAEGQQLIVGNRTNHTIAVIDAQTGMQKPDRVAGLRWTGKEDLLFLLGGRLGLYSRTDPTVTFSMPNRVTISSRPSMYSSQMTGSANLPLARSTWRNSPFMSVT